MIKKQLKLLNSQKRSRHEFISNNLVFSLRVRNESRIYECGNGGPYGWHRETEIICKLSNLNTMPQSVWEILTLNCP